MIAQFILAGPVFFFFPLGWLPFATLFAGKGDAPIGNYAFLILWGLAGTYGIFSLGASIILPSVHIKRIVGKIITTGLILGLAFSVCIMVMMLREMKPEIFSLWAILGPTTVACWNLNRIYRTRNENHGA